MNPFAALTYVLIAVGGWLALPEPHLGSTGIPASQQEAVQQILAGISFATSIVTAGLGQVIEALRGRA
jgi:hypothetical protein